jgi:hypothetical protein
MKNSWRCFKTPYAPSNFRRGALKLPALGLAETPQPCWFVEVKNKLGEKTPNDPLRLFYGGAITNSVGDYTLARLTEGSISEPIGTGFGEGFKVEGLSMRSANYDAPSGIIYAGYEF